MANALALEGKRKNLILYLRKCDDTMTHPLLHPFPVLNTNIFAEINIFWLNWSLSLTSHAFHPFQSWRPNNCTFSGVVMTVFQRNLEHMKTESWIFCVYA